MSNPAKIWQGLLQTFHFSRGQGSQIHCLLQPPGNTLLAAMVAHKEAEGNPLTPRRPHATSFRPNWTSHLASLKMCTLHTSFTVQNGPWPTTVLTEDAALLQMRPAPGMKCLTIYPPNIGVTLKRNMDFLNHLQKFPWPVKTPWLCPKFQFSMTGKSLLHFRGFPVWEGTLTWSIL